MYSKMIMITDFAEGNMAKRNFSSKRKAIYEALCSTDSHPSARWIYEKLKPDIPDLSLGTVYRNIALFKEEGKAQVICSLNSEERLDGNVSPHPHFICTCCNGVFDIGSDDSDSGIASELSERGFSVESRYILYYGICPDCKNKNIH